jgi:hypothetical protein
MFLDQKMSVYEATKIRCNALEFLPCFLESGYFTGRPNSHLQRDGSTIWNVVVADIKSNGYMCETAFLLKST